MSMENKRYYLELRGVNKKYGNFQASRNVNIQIEKGRLVALLGASGSGKTTILRIIAGLESPESGEILIDGKLVNNTPGSERGVGFVFQSYALFRYMTVYDNIAFGLRVKKKPRNYIDDRVHELLKLIDCEGLEKRYPSQLSGGQRQRVAFARALAPNPQLLLLDEPFAAIDAKIRLELRAGLREMITNLQITSIFVTHDQDEAIEVADEIIVMNHGEIEQTGSPRELYSHPQTPFVAQFIGASTAVENYQRFRFFQSLGDDTTAILRPEFVSVFKKGENKKYTESAEEGVVEDVIFRGSNLEIRVRIHGVVLSGNRGINDPVVEIGEKVDVFVYRFLVVDGKKIVRLDNSSLREESIII